MREAKDPVTGDHWHRDTKSNHPSARGGKKEKFAGRNPTLVRKVVGGGEQGKKGYSRSAKSRE